MRKKNGFTLIEIMVAVTLTGMILLTGYSTFQRIIQAQASLGATIDVQKNLFYTNEKLAALIRNGGTIDYEEYFNRRMLGYAQSKRSIDNIFTFTNYSHFGNGNNPFGAPQIYYCGFNNPPQNEEICLTISVNSPYGNVGTDKDNGPFTTAFPTGHQPYGQYAALALNYYDPVGYPVPIKIPPVLNSADTVKIASRDVNGIISLNNKNITEVGLPELYLIKKNLDNTYTRTYFRHVYVQDTFPGATTCTPITSLDGCLGKIQMLRLEGCDIGTPDGIVDAWIPNAEFMIGSITCSLGVDDIYTAAHEELIGGGNSPTLNWVDVTAPDMNVLRATFLPKPLKIPTLMSGAGDVAQSPSVSVYLEVALSNKLRSKSFVREDVNYPRTLITTYDLSE